MYTFLMLLQLVAGIALIALVLLQHGKGADAGAAFGSGASGTVFGARGAANFLSRATGGLAAVFFIVSLSLAYLVHDNAGDSRSLADQLESSQPAGSAGEPASSITDDTPAVPPADDVPTVDPDAPAVPE